MELKDWLAILSPIAAIIFGYAAFARNRHHDSRSEAADMTTIAVKLENINNGVSEIKSDLRNMKEDAKELRERLVVAEQSAKQAHKRLDSLIKQSG